MRGDLKGRAMLRVSFCVALMAALAGNLCAQESTSLPKAHHSLGAPPGLRARTSLALSERKVTR